MVTKNIQSRVIHKHDIEANWIKAVNFIPQSGEIIVYDIDDNYTYERFKIGDGIQNVNNLPFLNAFIQSEEPSETPDGTLWIDIDEESSDIIKIEIDSELNDTSENPVQNKIINAVINNLNNLIGDTSVAEQIANNIDITLTQSGMAADAKVVGDAINNIPSPLPEVTTDNNGGVLTVVDGEWSVGDIEIPVTSVNGMTGNVNLNANDVGALPITTEIPSIEGLATENYVDNSIASLNDLIENLETIKNGSVIFCEYFTDITYNVIKEYDLIFVQYFSAQEKTDKNYPMIIIPAKNEETWSDSVGYTAFFYSFSLRTGYINQGYAFSQRGVQLGGNTERLIMSPRPAAAGQILSVKSVDGWNNPGAIEWEYIDIPNSIETPTIASIGQTIVVKSIDENGKPTEWEAVDIPEQVQSDWNQNDESAADYIKNRPFYADDPVKTVVFEEETVTIGSDESYARCNGQLSLEVGKTYFVNFNDTEYECVAWKDDTYFYPVACVGNSARIDISGLGDHGDHGNGEPFMIEFYANGATFLHADASGEYTISVCEFITPIHQIDIKYISHDDTKMNVENPVCTGSFSMNRKEGSVIGFNSCSIGAYTTASGAYSHAEGYNTTASGDYSHAEGLSTIAAGNYSHVEGIQNIEDTNKKYAHIVGNGTSQNKRSNAHTLDWNGLGWFAGGLQVGGNAQDDGAKNVLLEGDAIPVPSTASIGQTIVVKAVDENGVPTEWEAVDPFVLTDESSGVKYKLSVVSGKLTMTEVTT